MQNWTLKVAFLATLGTLVATTFPSAASASRHRGSFRAPEVTTASWYGGRFVGRPMAGGGIFRGDRLTAAHRSLPFGTRVRVTDLRNGRSVIVRITDRGPYLPGRGIDLSHAAAKALGMVERGLAKVRIEVIRPERPGALRVVSIGSATETLTFGPRAIRP